MLAMFYFGRQDEERTVPFLWHLFLSSFDLTRLVRRFLMQPDTELTETATTAKRTELIELPAYFSTCILGHALPSCLRTGQPVR